MHYIYLCYASDTDYYSKINILTTIGGVPKFSESCVCHYIRLRNKKQEQDNIYCLIFFITIS